ncbi:MAG: hypothetical protein CMO34_03065 [Verrucomicrobia bacterium]|nr:hypothetical protein [Verrucomicrobiota bacterium]
MKLAGFILLSFFSTLLFAQESKEMLILQMEGNNYLRESFDEAGKIIRKDLLKVGKLNESKDQLSVKVKVYNYGKSGNIEDSSETKYTCNPKDEKILMNIFPFAAFSSDKTVKVQLNSKFGLYPSPMKVDSTLDDIAFTVSIEGGTLGFFGTNSKGTISNRKVVVYDPTSNVYTLLSRITIKSFLFGLNFNTISYAVKEKIHSNKGVLQQVFKEPSGEYFTIKLKQ